MNYHSPLSVHQNGLIVFINSHMLLLSIETPAGLGR